MPSKPISSAELLRVEEEQLYMFLSQIRPVGEEKSDLYPEPQYFTASFPVLAILFPEIFAKVAQRGLDAAAFGGQARQVLSRATALHFSGIAFAALWGREMLLLEPDVPGQKPGVVFDDGESGLTDEQSAGCLRFACDATRHYRRDGRAYPSDTQALGSDYRILSTEEAGEIAAKACGVDEKGARDVLGLMAAVRALSFLMEAETREALMVHGPYPLPERGHQLVIFECSDLRWPLFPNFPISGRTRWTLPRRPFPTANLAIVLVLRDVNVKADRFGTLYIEPMGPGHLVAATLLTRGADPYHDEGLQVISASEAHSLRRLCDEIQEYMFLQVASWDYRQRFEAGIFQEQTILLRILAAAGFGRSELEREQELILARGARIMGGRLEAIAARTTEQLPFFRRLGERLAQRTTRIFTPFTLSE
ncbi:MAG TPA: hypothetical protein VHB68_17325 [Steroidobacteraceae bacterium]|nr:hypothetical protein [Steroidobacteraceae bacterium]